ncbi:hypothetical protein [uncultured Ralstonia sp.]|jgi:hypothetical protein|uniref:HNH endonuclease n=1 Tax=Ralstonia sp. TaxID=54061 RepID=UPI001EA3DAFA|nr:hypothetical protein [uncultured Ralstonia sp.]UCF25455.1 MAG: HNH endonuclease [Ralstonia sp.]
MKSRSIRSHLKPYSIFHERRTTVAHAFASALAPSDPYVESEVIEALTALAQTDLDHLVCVYCRAEATTWDHLVNLVKDGKLNGYGHQLGNLVPCCSPCNSSKGGADFREFVRSLKCHDEEKDVLIQRLENHLARAKRVTLPSAGSKAESANKELEALQQQILDLMRKADDQAAIVRQLVQQGL